MTFQGIISDLVLGCLAWMLVLIVLTGTYMIFNTLLDEVRQRRRERSLRNENESLRRLVVTLRRAIRSGRTHELKPGPNDTWIAGVHTPPLTEYGSNITSYANGLVPSDKGVSHYE